MRLLSMHSKEFQRVLHNLNLENIHLSNNIQEEIIEFCNQKGEITPKVIKDILANDQGQST
ncbi:MAG TPA: Zn-dependent hydrolase [Bacillota bacterium]|nr:Zn-dependent hydrolase [Bacillota bacterium]